MSWQVVILVSSIVWAVVVVFGISAIITIKKKDEDNEV
jgi:hypothetical protein